MKGGAREPKAQGTSTHTHTHTHQIRLGAADQEPTTDVGTVEADKVSRAGPSKLHSPRCGDEHKGRDWPDALPLSRGAHRLHTVEPLSRTMSERDWISRDGKYAAQYGGHGAWLRQLSLTVAPRTSMDCIQWQRQSRWQSGLLLVLGLFETSAAILVGGSIPGTWLRCISCGEGGAISIGRGLWVKV